jgi:hypothetical protein
MRKLHVIIARRRPAFQLESRAVDLFWDAANNAAIARQCLTKFFFHEIAGRHAGAGI